MKASDIQPLEKTKDAIPLVAIFFLKPKANKQLVMHMAAYFSQEHFSLCLLPGCFRHVG